MGELTDVDVGRGTLHGSRNRTLQRIGRLKQQVNCLGGGNLLATAQQVEQVFRSVREVGHLGVPHRGSHPLDGVDCAKDAVHGLARPWISLQFQ